MDFFTVKQRARKSKEDGDYIEIYPDFSVCRSNDLMVRGKSFYAIWDEERGLWSTDEYDVQRLVDKELYDAADHISHGGQGMDVRVKSMRNFSSRSWMEFQSYVKNMSDSSVQLDNRLTFDNSVITRGDYVTKKLPYALEESSYGAWDEIVGTLYAPSERRKIEWAIGAVVSGDSKDIQKFVVFHGDPGTGKSTIMGIIQKLFEGYYTAFDANALTSSNNAFSTEVFKDNPLVAIQHDGDLSNIEDNTKLNSIVSHEDMTLNEKYKPSYMSRINAFLFMGTNNPVKISDSKAGIIRRLIDIHPSGTKIPTKRYRELMAQVNFELSGIAWHCLQFYREKGADYYASYRPLEMMLQTDVFFNYVEEHYFLFKEQDGVSLAQGYDLYKKYCEDTKVRYILPRHAFRDELKSYFAEFKDSARVDGIRVRSYYQGFLDHKFLSSEDEEDAPSLILDYTESVLDVELEDSPAQYASESGTPLKRWDDVTTTLKDIDSTLTHYVKPPDNHIVIDFDLTDDQGAKSQSRNIAAASKWPPTYAEFSKSGSGIHLHYLYSGNVEKLSRVFGPGIEIKVFTGNAALRRRLSKCNNRPVATLSSGLPLKASKMLDTKTVQGEKGLRRLVERNLRKEIHPGTKPSVDFIHKILEDAYDSGMRYDLSDMKATVLTFAASSSNQSSYCLRLVSQMKFQSEDASEEPENDEAGGDLVYFDLEVYPNLFGLCWKRAGDDQKVIKMINPKSSEIEPLLQMKLVGFNNRLYDNHILYAAYMGFSNHELYKLSQRLISNDQTAKFAEAYSLSYADVFDYTTKKQSLKKYQIELGLHHKEMGIPWDEPVPDDKVEEVMDYCANDVISTEKTAEARKADFIARQILADLSGLTVNDTTQKHTARIIFRGDKNHKAEFVYTDLSKMFPGYEYSFGKSTYKGEEVGEGGLVRSVPGIYENVDLFDVESMHPTSIIELNLFGKYTQRFKEILEARLAIKHGDFEKARGMLDGGLKPYLVDESLAKDLSYALKIAINIVYGLTSASFDNPFRDNRNKDNIVAKRGALFMVDLKEAVESRGFNVIHIKTDSIKVPGATKELSEFISDFGRKYGYSFEHEATYDKFALVNDAVYIAREKGEWSATGKQFAVPYVFKTLFSGEDIVFDDLCETKNVKTSLWLNFNEDLPDGQDNRHFVGRAGRFTPVTSGSGGAILERESDGEYHSATGAKGHRWLESEMVASLDKQDSIDYSYFDDLVQKAKDKIEEFGSFDEFVKET